jgi:hypothetical protein
LSARGAAVRTKRDLASGLAIVPANEAMRIDFQARSS